MPAGDRMRVIPGRSRVATKYGIVAASHPLAAQAGAQVLARGGHAVDAAIAANAVLGVVEPHMNGIGGDLFAIVYEAHADRLYGLNASGWTPQGLTSAVIKAEHGPGGMPAGGIHTVTVPGAVAGWEAMRARFGRRPIAELLQPAIFYANDGFPVSDIVAGAWNTLAARIEGEREAARTYLPAGRAPRAGEVFRNPNLAAALSLIASEGPAAFYRGPIARAILSLSRDRGGTMTMADLGEFAPEWVVPLSTTYRGWTVYEIPPNTQGVAALLMLDLMEQFPIADYGFQSADALHVMIEAKKLAYADMLHIVGDPRFVANGVRPSGKEAARTRAHLINRDRAAAHAEPSALAGLTNSAGNDTVYLAAIDRDGNIASLIQSIYEGFGSTLVPPGTGFALHNRGALFTLDDGHPNAIAPRKRPLHTIIPGFMRKGGVKIGFGIMGGFNQAQAHAQFVSNIADFGLDIQESLEAGRFTKPTFDGADVLVEALISEEVRRALAARGHDTECVAARSHLFGYGQAVMDAGAGVHFGASDPRHDGAAIPEAPPVFS
jgi:gamma-glutamyltranspeptidase/glutathione hydrolase